MLDGSELQPEIEHYDRTGKFLPGIQFPKGTLGDPFIDYSQIPSEDSNLSECKCKGKCKCKTGKTDSECAADATSGKEVLPAKESAASTYAVKQSSTKSPSNNFKKHAKRYHRRSSDKKAPSLENQTTTAKVSGPEANVIEKLRKPLSNKKQGSKRLNSVKL
jgi:hypothetical protein